MNKSLVASVVVFVSAATSTYADDLKLVWGGGDPSVSSYSADYVPIVINNLKNIGLNGYTWGGKSDGCVANMAKVTEHPTNLAICQEDMVNSAANKAKYKYTVIRNDLGFECFYAVTSLAGYSDFGSVLGNAFDLRVHTAGVNSGSMGSWNRLVELMPDLKDVTLINHDNDAEAVKAAKTDTDNGETAMAFFVKRPDPANATFKLIAENEMNFIPVLPVGDEAELAANEYTYPDLLVEDAGWGAFVGGKPKRVTTACTKIVAITGDPAAVEGKDLKRITKTLEGFTKQTTAEWQPEADWFQEMVNNMADAAPGKVEEMMASAKKTANDLAKKIAN